MLVEGIKECIYLQQFYPYVLAVLSTGLSLRGFGAIRALSKNFIIAFDNDDEGRKGIHRIGKRIRKSRGKYIEMIPPLKDWAECIGVKGIRTLFAVI